MTAMSSILLALPGPIKAAPLPELIAAIEIAETILETIYVIPTLQKKIKTGRTESPKALDNDQCGSSGQVADKHTMNPVKELLFLHHSDVLPRTCRSPNSRWKGESTEC
jgi:hypothetical protein